MTHLKTLLTKLKTPVLAIAGVTTAAVAVAMSFSTVHAWGPERPTYTNKAPADHATFNSIIDNVAVGDERNFVRIREAGTSDTYVDELEIVPGHEYEVYIYYHNNAGSDTNASGYGVATNARVSSAYPTVVNTNERGMISGIISWSYVTPSDPDNAETGTVWDEAYVTSKVDGVVLKYKTGTAIIHNGGKANGSVLPSDLFTKEGTPLGYNVLTGTLPGCAEYSGHITYTLVAENPGSSLTKQVSSDGENWDHSITAKPGDILTYKVAFENTGNTNFTNLILTDTHDEDLILRAGSTKIFDYQHVEGYIIDDIIDISGFNTGDILAGGLVQATYQMQVRNDDSSCGKTLSNTITADFNSTEQKTDTTTVEVVCDEEPVAPTPENPTPETPSEIVNTGPLEIAMAAVVIVAIGGAGFYLWRTKHTLKTVEEVVTGASGNADGQAPVAPTAPKTPSGSTPSTPVSPTAPESTPSPVDMAVKQSSTPVQPAGFSQSTNNSSAPTLITSNPATPAAPTAPTEPSSTDNSFDQFNSNGQ